MEQSVDTILDELSLVEAQVTAAALRVDAERMHLEDEQIHGSRLSPAEHSLEELMDDLMRLFERRETLRQQLGMARGEKPTVSFSLRQVARKNSA